MRYSGDMILDVQMYSEGQRRQSLTYLGVSVVRSGPWITLELRQNSLFVRSPTHNFFQQISARILRNGIHTIIAELRW